MSHAQQLPLFSQYMLNGFVINSAMAGYDGYTTFNLTSRQQWLGFDNAPRTFAFTAQTRILKRSYIIKTRLQRGNKFIRARSGRVGVGLSVFNDRNGYFGNSGISLSYAYHIPFPNAQLSFGLSNSISQFNIDKNGIGFRDNSDDLLKYVGKPMYIPDVNVGVYYESNSFYGGLSALNLMQSKVKYGNTGLKAYKTKIHYFLLGGYRFTDQVRFIYEPSVLVRTTDAFLPNIDLSFKVLYNESYWAGISYRTDNAMIIFLGLIMRNISIGYAFDYDFNSIQRISYGSHELNMSLRFGDSAKRYRWIRRY